MSNFVGVNKDYRKILQLTEEALNVLYGTGYAISDMCYFGIDNETKNKEWENFEAIQCKLEEVRDLLIDNTKW